MSAVRPPNTGLVDLVAVRRCDRLFDALAARRDVPCDAPTVRLLTALNADVDAGLPSAREPFAEPEDEYDTPSAPDPCDERRGRRARLRRMRAALTAGAAAVAVVATAITAAELGSFEPVGRVLGVVDRSPAPSPSRTAAVRVTEAVTTARQQLDRGQYGAARQTIRTAWRYWGDMRGSEATAMASVIERVEARLVRETADPDVPAGSGATGGSQQSPGQAPRDPSPASAPTGSSGGADRGAAGQAPAGQDRPGKVSDHPVDRVPDGKPVQDKIPDAVGDRVGGSGGKASSKASSKASRRGSDPGAGDGPRGRPAHGTNGSSRPGGKLEDTPGNRAGKSAGNGANAAGG